MTQAFQEMIPLSLVFSLSRRRCPYLEVGPQGSGARAHRSECVFHWLVALDLRVSTTLDMRGDRGSPTRTACDGEGLAPGKQVRQLQRELDDLRSERMCKARENI